ncbi:MAG: DUF1549 and DUF1553 domain-containing protein [Chthonomonadales bacterium]
MRPSAWVLGVLFAFCAIRVEAQHGAPEFLRDIAPILDKSGCSVAACHGKFGGRGGFQLSLLTLSPEDDYEPIVYGGRGRRVNFAAPEKSLILLKPTMQVPHGGGQRFAVGSPQYRTILRWIRAGAPFSPKDPRLVSFSLAPSTVAFARVGQKQKLRAVARFTDGSVRDVTAQAVLQSTNDAVLSVTPEGWVQAKRWGGGAVLGRYLGAVAASFITVPQARRGPYPSLPQSNLIDRFVFQNLHRLNVLPSRLSSDEEFLRRVTLDTLGRLPTPDEIEEFVSSRDANKRTKLVDRLLADPQFTDLYTLRLCDLLRVNPRRLGNNGSLADRAAALFYEWIWKSVKENKPWDRFVREILTAKGSTYQVGPANFYRIEREPNDRMETIGQAFLGVRMACARCHKHPFDRWTTDDYWNFSAFCAKVGARGGRLYDEMVIVPENNAQLRNQSVVGRNRGKIAQPTFLGDGQPAPPSDDMIGELADWLVSPKNPFFARAAVNRIWSYYFGRGIIQPVDDMRQTTPPSVPGLLEALATEFVRSGYNVRALVRLILTSRTYQLSSVPNASNRLDDRFFSRYQPKPMPAQVLLDVVNQATGADERFSPFEDRDRAIQAMLPVSNEFLTAFGQSHREFLADINPKLEPNLVQTLMMINSPYIENKIEHGATVGEVLKETHGDDELVKALYLRTLCRTPSAAEVARAGRVLRGDTVRTPAKPPARPATSQRLVRVASSSPAGLGNASGQAVTGPKAAQNLEAARRERAQDLLWALITAREFYFNH